MKNENPKLIISKMLNNIFKFLIIIFTLSFLLFNLLSSQNISPLYYPVTKENRLAVVDFLSRIKKLPEFDRFLAVNKNIYGESLEPQVFAESVKRKQSIQEYENLVKQTPKSRDILYNLYLLYSEDDNEQKAEEYLKKAKNIDPSLNQ